MFAYIENVLVVLQLNLIGSFQLYFSLMRGSLFLVVKPTSPGNSKARPAAEAVSPATTSQSPSDGQKDTGVDSGKTAGLSLKSLGC